MPAAFTGRRLHEPSVTAIMKRKDRYHPAPSLTTILSLLGKIDRLHLPATSRRDLESILVRQAVKGLDQALPWQQEHGRRTAVIALMIGQTVGLDADNLHHLKLAGLLHDIGLLTLPPHLLIEPGSWDAEAYVAMQCHPRIGAELLEPFRFLREASVLVAHHHERWDGTGYPYGLRGAYIPLGARILSIADAFDAIEVPNVASPNVRTKVAYRILRVAAGTQFDPDLIEACGRCLAKTAHDRFIHSTPLCHQVASESLKEESP